MAAALAKEGAREGAVPTRLCCLLSSAVHDPALQLAGHSKEFWLVGLMRPCEESRRQSKEALRVGV